MARTCFAPAQPDIMALLSREIIEIAANIAQSP
jgi:hypothetical protein